MQRTLVIARRVLAQLRHDPRFLALSVVAPLIIIGFLKIFFDTFPPGFNSARYIVPIAAFIVHFLGFLLCAIVLVQERSAGTLERMFINGFRRVEIIGGYVLGYTALATLQALVVLVEVLWLFDLDYSAGQLGLLFLVIWLLALASVMMGMFISTFARNEGQIFPFIPLVSLPSVFLSGLMVDVERLPEWAQVISYGFPLTYANNVIQRLIGPEGGLGDEGINIVILVVYGLVLLIIASRTLRDVE